MADDGIGEIAQLMSVSFNGLKIGADFSLEALRLLKRMASILYHAMQAMPYRRKVGKTNMENMKARLGENLQYVSMSPEVHKKFQKFAKKSGILYAKLPNFNGDGRIFIAVSQNAGPLLQEFLNSIEKQYVKARGDEEAGNQFKKDNVEISMQEYYAASGCHAISDEEFCRKMAKEYPDSFELEKEMENWQKKSLPVTEEQAKIREAIEEALLRNKDRELVAKENSFVLNFTRTQVVGMNENQYKVHIGNTSGDCVWVDKDKVVVAGNGICRAAIGNEEKLSVSDLEDELPFRKIRGDAFREEMRLARQKEAGYDRTGTKMNQSGKQTGQKGQEDAGNKKIVQESVLWINHQNQADKNWITISKENIRKTDENAILFRIPNTRCMEYLWLDKKDLKEVHNGKSYAYEMDREREYEISYANGKKCGNMQGSELVDRHFDIKDEKLKNVPVSKARKR